MDLRVDGRVVFAATGGKPLNPGSPAVVFLHGAGMDHTVWTLQTRFFAHHGRSVLAVDLPGHGRSAGPPLASIGDLADWLCRVLDAAGLPRAALVGHSMGSLIALEAAARAPARVWAVALLGAAESMPVHPDLLAAAAANDHLAIDLVASWGFGRRAHLGGCRAPGLWMLGSGMRLLERNPGPALAADLEACHAYHGALEAASRVRCPALLLLGEIDRMTPPENAAELGRRIDDARTVVLARCGHMMMVERPDDTLEALLETI
ncbi:MAG: alpha/beta fold hydrolase [Pseudomonadota bacterium]